MMLLIPLFFFTLLASVFGSQQCPLQSSQRPKIFFCHQLHPSAAGNILTFQYRNPQTNGRGVVCAIMDSQRNNAQFYLEEEIVADSPNHVGGFGFASRSADGMLTGNLWKFGASNDDSTSPNVLFTANPDPKTGLITIQVSGQSMIWYPRNREGVPNWTMSADLMPRSCPQTMQPFILTDPIDITGLNGVNSVNVNGVNGINGINSPLNSDAFDRHGLICLKPPGSNDGTADFFATGWRRVEGSGHLRKFVNFGRLRRGRFDDMPHALDGQVLNLYFLTDFDYADNTAAVDVIAPVSYFRAIPSQQGNSFLLLGELKEKWMRAGVDAHVEEKYII